MQGYLPVPVIAVVGSRKSGKTTTVESITAELTKRDYRVATVKHINEPNFTINPAGKDTWRHAEAGAHITIGVAQKELAIVKRTDTTKLSLNDITQNIGNDTDIIITEGFRNLVKQDQTIPKIVSVKNKKEIEEATQTFKPILAFTGSITKTETVGLKIPYVDVQKEPSKLTEIIEKRVKPIIEKRREAKETLTININNKVLPLNPYVQKVTRNVLLAIISTLKGATIRGNENITITLEDSIPTHAT
jgi:molybdopterin-guanine dinucleotide biosynthesis protein MobB